MAVSIKSHLELGTFSLPSKQINKKQNLKLKAKTNMIYIHL